LGEQFDSLSKHLMPTSVRQNKQTPSVYQVKHR